MIMFQHKIKRALIVLGMTAMISAPIMAQEPLTVNVSRISMEVANTIAMNAIKACRDKGIPISVTVVDRSGIIQVQLRDTVAPPVTLGMSQKKAYTAVMFNLNGSKSVNYAKTPLQHIGEGLAFMAGSVTISAGGKLYGAVGVSGAPDGMDDEACASAGVASVIENLEMQ